jgi:pyruvate-ferredoxin/flavodoxin oxidoreductase
LIIAYGSCIAHGYDLRYSLEHQKNAVQTGYWPLYRFNPALAAEGKNPFILDSKPPSTPLEQYTGAEDRYKMLQGIDPEQAKKLAELAQADVDHLWKRYQALASGA